MKFRDYLAAGILLFVLAIFTIVIWKQLGGTEALFAILGYLFAWGNMTVIFYFRKKPKGEIIE